MKKMFRLSFFPLRVEFLDYLPLFLLLFFLGVCVEHGDTRSKVFLSYTFLRTGLRYLGLPKRSPTLYLRNILRNENKGASKFTRRVDTSNCLIDKEKTYYLILL